MSQFSIPTDVSTVPAPPASIARRNTAGVALDESGTFPDHLRSLVASKMDVTVLPAVKKQISSLPEDVASGRADSELQGLTRGLPKPIDSEPDPPGVTSGHFGVAPASATDAAGETAAAQVKPVAKPMLTLPAKLSVPCSGISLASGKVPESVSTESSQGIGPVRVPYVLKPTAGPSPIDGDFFHRHIARSRPASPKTADAKTVVPGKTSTETHLSVPPLKTTGTIAVSELHTFLVKAPQQGRSVMEADTEKLATPTMPVIPPESSVPSSVRFPEDSRALLRPAASAGRAASEAPASQNGKGSSKSVAAYLQQGADKPVPNPMREAGGFVSTHAKQPTTTQPDVHGSDSASTSLKSVRIETHMPSLFVAPHALSPGKSLDAPPVAPHVLSSVATPAAFPPTSQEISSQPNVSPLLSVPPADAAGPVHTLFSQMDSVVIQDRHTPSGVMRTLEVGFQDSGSGAVGVHAHLIGGQVSAVIQVEKEQARSAVSHELPAVEQFLSLANVEVKHVSVNVSDHGAGQSADPERESTPRDQRASHDQDSQDQAGPSHKAVPQSVSSTFEPEERSLISVEA